MNGYEPNVLAFNKSSNKGFKVFNNFQDIHQKYDSITSINVLRHIEDDNAALDQIKSLMKEDSN